MTNKIVGGVVMPLTPAEQAEFDAPETLDAIKEKACKKITDHRTSKYTGVIPVTISSGTFNYPYSELLAMAHFNRYQAITANLMQCPAYWRDEDNNNNPVVASDFLAIGEAANSYMSNFATRAHSDKALIMLATNEADINNIVNAYLAYDGS